MMAIIGLRGRSVIKGFIATATALGIAVGLIGLDRVGGTLRFGFGLRALRNGIDTAPMLIDLLAVSELFGQARQTFSWSELSTDFDAPFPPRDEIRKLQGYICLRTIVGATPRAGTRRAALRTILDPLETALRLAQALATTGRTNSRAANPYASLDGELAHR